MELQRAAESCRELQRAHFAAVIAAVLSGLAGDEPEAEQQLQEQQQQQQRRRQLAIPREAHVLCALTESVDKFLPMADILALCQIWDSRMSLCACDCARASSADDQKAYQSVQTL